MQSGGGRSKKRSSTISILQTTAARHEDRLTYLVSAVVAVVLSSLRRGTPSPRRKRRLRAVDGVDVSGRERMEEERMHCQRGLHGIEITRITSHLTCLMPLSSSCYRRLRVLSSARRDIE